MVSFVTGENMKTTRVLIVDDMEQVRRDLRTVLTLSGDIEIVGEAANGLEAIRLAESLTPDVILMDLEMPILNGYEATHRIKNHRPSCKVIALTVHAYESARAKALRDGVDNFVVKGAPVEELVRAIISPIRKE